MANLSLIDHQNPMAERVFYLDRNRSVKMIIEENLKFNIMEFEPDIIGEDSYESDSIKMERGYYSKL